MEHQRQAGAKGWLLVYVVGSIPLFVIYSVGLAGWFFDYPAALIAVIFLLLSAPLLLILRRSPQAPKWNITLLWLVAALMTLRAISVFLFPGGEGQMSPEELPGVALTLLGIVSVSVSWAAIWTQYFRTSTRVSNTFS